MPRGAIKYPCIVQNGVVHMWCSYHQCYEPETNFHKEAFRWRKKQAYCKEAKQIYQQELREDYKNGTLCSKL